VNVVRPELPEASIELSRRRQCDANFRVERHGERRERRRLDDLDGVPHGTERADGRVERADDAVDLRVPGVGRDEYASH
jgi:hypothetical protein